MVAQYFTIIYKISNKVHFFNVFSPEISLVDFSVGFSPLLFVHSAASLCNLLRLLLIQHFPHCLKCYFFNLPSCSCPAFSTCPSPSDGIIHVILSIYTSSDTNGCTANPAAGESGLMPKLGVPSEAAAAPVLSGASRLFGSTNAQQSGRWWQDCE